jgi:hypothetical protein
MMFVAFFIAKLSWMCQKSQKRPFLFVSKLDVHFPWWRTILDTLSRRNGGENGAAAVSKVQASIIQRKSEATNTHTDSQNKECPTHSKFKFQIQIAWNTPKVVSGAKKIAPRLHMYECMWIVTRCVCTVSVRPLVGTQNVLAAPTVHAEVCSHVWQNSKFKLIIDVTY